MMLMIIVEFGQQRQRCQLKQNFYTMKNLLELFSEMFKRDINLDQYEIILSNEQLDEKTIIDFLQLENYQRFQIQSKIEKNQHQEIIALKQRVNRASVEAMEVAFLIKSIYVDYQTVLKKLTNNSNVSTPPDFQSLSTNSDPENESVFESACSIISQSKSNYLECREDLTIVNQRTKLEWRNPRNSNSNKKKKPINPNKPPLPAEKKKNIPCKYAAGGNCKRGKRKSSGKCQRIVFFSRKSMSIYSCRLAIFVF